MGRDGSSIVDKIVMLKEKRRAVILAHNYQPGMIQEIADYVGDSLDLSRRAATSRAEVIVFCGVRFMAETAAILCPDKIVLMPDVEVGCPMANMINVKSLLALKSKNQEAAVVCYINTSAAIKAESDICCTSSNAVSVIESIPERQVIFVPDKYLAHYVSKKTKKKIIPWNGYCPTHVKILAKDIGRQKKLHPKAKVMVHPECTPPVIALADAVLSTAGMCKFARQSKADEMIVGTEVGILYRLRGENPTKRFIAASEAAVCPNMKRTTLEKLLWSLESLTYRIQVPQKIRLGAEEAINKMLKLG